MDRRRFLSTTVAGILAAPLGTEGQQAGRIPRIGLLSASSRSSNAARIEAFHKGLADLGYADGKTLAIEYRSADGQLERLPDLAAEVIRLGVDVIVALGLPAALAAKQATTTIP